MSLLDAYRQHPDPQPDDGSVNWLLHTLRQVRGVIKGKAKRKSAVEDVIGDLNYYEILIGRIQPLTDLAQHEGYRQWRDETLRRLDADLNEWPERCLNWIGSGHTQEQVAMATAVFAATQIMGRRAFTVADAAVEEKQRYDRYQEKAKSEPA